LFGAIAFVAVLAAGASALTGGGRGPDLGPGVRVGETSQTDHDSDHEGASHEDRGDDDAVDHDDGTPVTPGSEPADFDDDSDHDDRDGYDSDHDGDDD
jgi:hypothetical protein